MKGHHASKTISFLMELIFTLFFFTIASAISVFVLVSAKEKNDTAIYTRNALLYGENLIAQQEDGKSPYLSKDVFYMDEKGMPTDNKAFYKVEIKRDAIIGLSRQEQCSMQIKANEETLTTLSFLYNKGDAE